MSIILKPLRHPETSHGPQASRRDDRGNPRQADQRIVLRDAPAILGSPSSEASQLRCLSSMTGQLRELMDSGRVRRTDAEALAWLLNGALVDAALRIANAEHPPESLARACQALDVLLDGLLME